MISGFQRGSKQLGVPTANIEMTPENESITRDLVPGVYAATGTLRGIEYPCAISIGWNPVYDNEARAVEVFLIHTFEQDFYGEQLAVNLKSFVRAEALFASFDSLILSI